MTAVIESHLPQATTHTIDTDIKIGYLELITNWSFVRHHQTVFIHFQSDRLDRFGYVIQNPKIMRIWKKLWLWLAFGEITVKGISFSYCIRHRHWVCGDVRPTRLVGGWQTKLGHCSHDARKKVMKSLNSLSWCFTGDGWWSALSMPVRVSWETGLPCPTSPSTPQPHMPLITIISSRQIRRTASGKGGSSLGSSRHHRKVQWLRVASDLASREKEILLLISIWMACETYRLGDHLTRFDLRRDHSGKVVFY